MALKWFINVYGTFHYNVHNIETISFQNNPNSGQVSFPGILAGWREDLQGKERRDSSTLERDVFVTTNYGQVQGFKVYMYDNPDPKSFYRPYHSTVDRVMGECTVFLGIPYAMPPTFEGRFKPPRLHRGWQLMQAVDFGPACPQPLRFTSTSKGVNDMDEDCLYLNIFSPQVTFFSRFMCRIGTKMNYSILLDWGWCGAKISSYGLHSWWGLYAWCF